MDFLLIGYILICFLGIKINNVRNLERSIPRSQTIAINGFFVMLIFLRHAAEFVEFGKWDRLCNIVNHYSGQLIVVSFLFFSGYGIAASYLKKGMEYIRQFPVKRIFFIWFRFANAVVLYVLLSFVTGKHYSLKTVLLAFTGWTTIGNSGWFVFALLMLYIFTWLCFRLGKGHIGGAVAGIVILTVLYMLLVSRVKEDWWYNTVIVFPLGMIYRLAEEKIHNFLNRSRAGEILLFLICMGLFAGSVLFVRYFAVYECAVILFAVLLVLTAQHVRFQNKILSFLGTYSFEIFLLQRIPLRLFEKFSTTGVLYVIICIAVTLAFSVLFRRYTDWFMKRYRDRY